MLAVRHTLKTPALAEAVVGGLFFSVGDLSTKLATQGGARVAFVLTLIGGYTIGTSLLQIAYQRAAALTVAGMATLLTDAVPTAAGTIVLHEPVPAGGLGALRILAFAAVTAGGILLATPELGVSSRRRPLVPRLRTRRRPPAAEPVAPRVDADGLLRLKVTTGAALPESARAVIRRHEGRARAMCATCGGSLQAVQAGPVVQFRCARCRHQVPATPCPCAHRRPSGRAVAAVTVV